MDKMDYFLAGIGAVTGFLFGGLDVLIQVFAAVLIIDTVSGMIKAHINGTYTSKEFRIGLWKKSGYVLALLFVVQLDRIAGNSGIIRNAVLFTFIYNEGTSVVENIGQMGIKLPETVKGVLGVFKQKGEAKIPEDQNQQ